MGARTCSKREPPTSTSNITHGTVSTSAVAEHGTVTVNEATGEITYTPDSNFHGSDTLTVTGTDDDGASDSASQSITTSPG